MADGFLLHGGLVDGLKRKGHLDEFFLGGWGHWVALSVGAGVGRVRGELVENLLGNHHYRLQCG